MNYITKTTLLLFLASLTFSLLLSGPSFIAYANESSGITEKTLVIKGGKPGARISIHQLNAFGRSGTVAKCKSPCKETVKLADPFYITIPTRRNKFETYLRRNSSEAEVKGGVYHFDITPRGSEEEAAHYYRSFSSDVNNLPKRQKCFNFTKADLSERPKSCFKNTALLPARMERSGSCIVRFKVLPNGASEGVTVSDCTEDMFRLPSLEAAKLFRYYPRLLNEEIITSKIKTRVRFDLNDGRGKRIPAKGESK